MRFLRLVSFTLVILGAALFLPQKLGAEGLPVPPGGFVPVPVIPGGGISDADLGLDVGQYTGLSNADPRLMVARMIRVFIGLLGIIFLIVVLIAGFTLMTSAGNSEKVDAAKQWLWGGVIGLIIILAAYAITSFVISQLTKATTPGHQIELRLF